ncbi:hypothetical protein GCM10023238_36590 [Streptomyces heliomycini]
MGQVYTTLSRLERDGMVVQDGEDEAGHPLYAITDSVASNFAAGSSTPSTAPARARDELAIKLAMAVGAPGSTSVTSSSPSAAHREGMQDYTRLKAQASPPWRRTDGSGTTSPGSSSWSS